MSTFTFGITGMSHLDLLVLYIHDDRWVVRSSLDGNDNEPIVMHRCSNRTLHTRMSHGGKWFGTTIRYGACASCNIGLPKEILTFRSLLEL